MRPWKIQRFRQRYYYQQVRRCLLDLEKHKACHPELTRQPIDDALRYSILPHRDYWFDRTTTENYTGKLDRVHQLFCGNRQWGQRINARGGSNAEGATQSTSSVQKRSTTARFGWPISSL